MAFAVLRRALLSRTATAVSLGSAGRNGQAASDGRRHIGPGAGGHLVCTHELRGVSVTPQSHVLTSQPRRSAWLRHFGRFVIYRRPMGTTAEIPVQSIPMNPVRQVAISYAPLTPNSLRLTLTVAHCTASIVN
jgi:hypothetical protein